VITAVVSRKGGVGKTTTAVNLAGALAGIGKRVLLVDLDSQASASLSLGVRRNALAPSIADALFHHEALADTVRTTGVDGLDLVTASADLASFDVDFATDPKRELQLTRALSGIQRDYDFVFLDCPSSLSLLPINALVAAHGYIAPVVPNHLSLIGLPNLLATVARLYRRFDKRTELLGIVPTLVDYRLRSHRDHIEAIRRQYGPQVFAIEIRVNTRLAEAPAHGKTVFEFDSKSTGARAYRLLAAEILMRANRDADGQNQSEPDGVRPAVSDRIAI